jgi:peptide methionine sulfoxide reductase msrA/msrB
MAVSFFRKLVVLMSIAGSAEPTVKASTTEPATFAGGCFWCMQPPFEQLGGVTKVVVGYTGGRVANPTYEQVCSGKTGHLEAVEVQFDPSIVSYPELLDVFWRNIDPTDGAGQFADRGSQYHTAIFVDSDSQRRSAEESKQRLAQSGTFKQPITTKILNAAPFYPAENYHQDYYRTNAQQYQRYKQGSGRADFLKKFWHAPQTGAAKAYAKPSVAELREKLTPEQYSVTQQNGTERAFENRYWNNHRAGLYVDIVSGEPLFGSVDKFDSGSGWPSFTQPVDGRHVVEKVDSSHGMTRVEIRSAGANSHLGHCFDDGPGPTRKRYCINSAALRFIPVADLEKEGYGEYARLFR